jgi:hypothetical protein
MTREDTTDSIRALYETGTDAGGPMRLIDVIGNQPACGRRIATSQRIHDRRMLAPDLMREAWLLEHLAHRAAQMLPVRPH